VLLRAHRVAFRSAKAAKRLFRCRISHGADGIAVAITQTQSQRTIAYISRAESPWSLVDDGVGAGVDPVTSTHGIPEPGRRPMVDRVADVGYFV
jgi:hypothetical protein